jgi:hypothetical protein
MRTLLAAVLCLAFAASAAGVEARAAKAQCTPTVPARAHGAHGFNYGNAGLRVQLGWPKGRLPAGILPDGGSYATVTANGSIHTKVGWWRGVPGRLRISGKRLDGMAPPLEASVPPGYGPRGFQPTGLVFPTTGCWRVEGRVGAARLTFVVRVTKLRWH